MKQNSGFVMRLLAQSVFPLILVCGCAGGAGDAPETGAVTGTITMDGEPLAGKSVVFTSADGRVAFGATNDQGMYEINYIDNQKGAVLGQNKVSVTTPTENPDPNFKETIPRKYNENTELTADVQPGGNVFDFELTSK